MTSIEVSAVRDDDLASNRAGRISAVQSERLRSVVDQVARGGVTAAQLVALLAAMFAPPVLAQLAARSLALRGAAQSALVAAGVLGSALAIAGTLAYLRSDGVRRRGLARDPFARALRDDLAAGRVAAVEGVMRWRGEGYEADVEGAPVGLTAHAGPVPVHRVVAPPGRYRFYVLPASRLAVSLEPVGDGVDREAYARALDDAMGASPQTTADPRVTAVEGPATVRYEARARDDDRVEHVPVLEVLGVPVDVTPRAAAAVAPGFALRAWFVIEGDRRRAVRLEPA